MSSTSPRLKRTPPERSGPVRNPMAPSQNGSPQNLVTAAGAAVCGVLENGVRTAYAVIDEYMRRGQEAARGIFNDSNRRGPMSDSKSSFPGRFDPSGGFNASNPMAMIAEQWMTAMRAWSQAWSAFVPGAWQQPGFNPFAAAPSQAAATTVQVSVAASSPVDVTVNVSASQDSAGLVSDPLRAEGATAPPIEPATITRDAGALRVSLQVPSKQPPGRYRGCIRRKADESIVGELTVVVG